jgi:hypothetical protein
MKVGLERLSSPRNSWGKHESTIISPPDGMLPWNTNKCPTPVSKRHYLCNQKAWFSVLNWALWRCVTLPNTIWPTCARRLWCIHQGSTEKHISIYRLSIYLGYKNMAPVISHLTQRHLCRNTWNNVWLNIWVPHGLISWHIKLTSIAGKLSKKIKEANQVIYLYGGDIALTHL